MLVQHFISIHPIDISDQCGGPTDGLTDQLPSRPTLSSLEPLYMDYNLAKNGYSTILKVGCNTECFVFMIIYISLVNFCIH